MKKEKREKMLKKKRDAGPKSDAIILGTSEAKSYADVLRDLRIKAGTKLDGIQSVRKSRGGDGGGELAKDTDMEKLEKTIKETLGDEQNIKKKKPKILLEIKHIDPTVDREEMTDAITRKLDIKSTDLNIKTIKTTYEGIKRLSSKFPPKWSIK